MTAKILLIEDDSTMLTLLRTLLNFEGYEVAQLEKDEDLDIERTMNAIRRELPAAVLLDVHLRELNGFDLLRSVRQDDELKDTRIIISSGIDFSKRSEIEGADGFLLKPYMPEDLIRKIRKTLAA